MERNLRIFYVTGTEKNLKEIARKLLEDKSAIGANIMRSEALYNRNGELIEEQEYVGLYRVVIKSAYHCQELFDKIEQLHEAKVPLILDLPPVDYINDKSKNYYNKEGYNITTP